MNYDYVYGSVIPDDMPEDLLGNPDVQRLLDNIYAVLQDFDRLVDPNSEGYQEELYIARRDGAVTVVERYQSMLDDALYRQRLFGEPFDLERFIDRLSKIEIEEVIHG
jgi:hypothetical protein